MPLSDFAEGAGAFAGEFLVYMRAATTVGAMDTLEAYNTEKGTYKEIGECKGEDIKIEIKKDKAIKGNKRGTKYLRKILTFACNILNVTPANITALESADGTSVDVLLHNAEDGYYILIPAVMFDYEESTTSGNESIVPVSIEKSGSSASALRTRALIPTS